MATVVWQAAFIVALEECGRPYEAAHMVEVHPTTAYKLRQRDDSFAERWDAALAEHEERERERMAKALGVDPSRLS